MARNTRYTQSDVDWVVDALRKGATFKAACASAGVADSSFRDFLKAHPRISARVNTARARARSKLEASLYQSATEPDKQGRRDTKAAELWLTNQYPEEWKNRRDFAITSGIEDAAEIKKRREELSNEAIVEHQELAHKEILRQGKREREQLH